MKEVLDGLVGLVGLRGDVRGYLLCFFPCFLLHGGVFWVDGICCLIYWADLACNVLFVLSHTGEESCCRVVVVEMDSESCLVFHMASHRYHMYSYAFLTPGWLA